MTTVESGRKALVTGSSSGIGAAICRRLVDDGFSVIGLSRTPGSLESTPLKKGAFEHLEVDLAALDRLPSRLVEIARLHPDVEVLVLSAGRGAFGSLKEFSYDQIRELIDLNFLSQSKFALRGFAQALRQEASSRGVRVSFISPGMTRTPFYDSLSFSPGEEPENALEASDVADAVALAISSRAEAVIDEIRLSPLKHVVRRKPRSN